MPITLIENDVIVALRQHVPDASVDVVVTSPPYNMGQNYNVCRDNRSTGDYLDWCVEWGREIFRILKPDGSFFLNLGSYSKSPMLPNLVLDRMVKDWRDTKKLVNPGHVGFRLQNTITWVKSIAIDKEGSTTSFGHFTPINSERFLNFLAEPVYHLTKSGNVKINRLALGVPYQDKSNIDRWEHTKGRDKRCRGNVWFIPYSTIQLADRDRPHPTPFPPGLPEFCIRLHGKKKMVVVDPFVGGGNSGLACLKCKDQVDLFIGIDIDKVYLDQTRELLNSSPSEHPSGLSGEHSEVLDAINQVSLNNE